MTAENAERGAARRPPPPLPFTVLTGFLGAGKTTLLNSLLAAPQLSDTLVLINEFGEIGLDHLFVEKIDGDTIVMSSGCVCCTMRGELVATLEDMLRRRDNGAISPFRRVVLETTGLADPAPALHAIMRHPYLMLRYRLDGVVTLVDAVNGEATLDAHEEAVKQAAVADRLVITKTDLRQGAAQLETLRARLKRLNPTARQLIAAAGEATPQTLLDCGLYAEGEEAPRVAQWLDASDEDHDHEDDHNDGHAHERRSAHEDRIRSFCLASETPLPPAGFDMFLEFLTAALGPNLLRVKGVVALADDPSRPVAIHGVQHVFHPPHRLAAWPDDDHRTRIVFIVRDVEEQFLQGLYAAFAGAPRVDGADAAALANNPLAPRTGGLLG
ncbi:MAG TPA: GTP-binding protein [Methylocystis sp.]|nr:GTP-binding protein [Methylocystis sp.]